MLINPTWPVCGLEFMNITMKASHLCYATMVLVNTSQLQIDTCRLCFVKICLDFCEVCFGEICSSCRHCCKLLFLQVHGILFSAWSINLPKNDTDILQFRPS